MTIEEIKIDVDTLAKWLADKKPVTILDVRPKAERKEWSIPGSIHADVYDKLKVNDANAMNYLNLDKSKPVVTVCTGGKTSLTAAEMLKQQGFDVYSLDGGMKAWNFAWNTAEITLHGVKIIQVRRSSKGCLSYILGSEDEAVVIDAALDPQVYLDLATSNGWSINYVADTHVHADFLSRTRELAKVALAKHILIDNANVEYPFTPLKNGEYVEFGNALLQAIHTPGHTWESTTFRLGDDAVFTGDTLFVDGVGRPDLKADQGEAVKRASLLYQSLHQLMKLNPKTLVLPGHKATAVSFDGKLIAETIETLRGKLDMLGLSEKDFLEYTLSHVPPAPPNYLTIASLNKQGSYEGYSPLELEAGANHCAIA